MNYKMYVIVNQDVKMSKAKMAAQVGHAVGVYYYYGMGQKEVREKIDGWHKDEITKIVLKASEEELKEIMKNKKIYTCPIHDAGHTQIPSGTLTCVGLGILDVEDEKTFEERPFLKKLKLA